MPPPSRLTATLFMPTATASVHVHAVRIDEAVSAPFRVEVDFDTSVTAILGDIVEIVTDVLQVEHIWVRAGALGAGVLALGRNGSC